MKKLLTLSMILCSGCGISVTQSGIKAGIMDREVKEQDGCRVVVETVTGLQIQWAPEFDWTDVKRWFKKEEQPGSEP